MAFIYINTGWKFATMKPSLIWTHFAFINENPEIGQTDSSWGVSPTDWLEMLSFTGLDYQTLTLVDSREKVGFAEAVCNVAVTEFRRRECFLLWRWQEVCGFHCLCQMSRCWINCFLRRIFKKNQIVLFLPSNRNVKNVWELSLHSHQKVLVLIWLLYIYSVSEKLML